MPISESYSSLDWSLAVDVAGAFWLPNHRDHRLVKYAVSTSGLPKLSATISGSETGLEGPDALAVDERGYLYVANSEGRTVTIYRPDSVGAAVPNATIFGPATELNAPHAIAAMDSEVFVANSNEDRVLIFGTNANADVAPVSILEVRPEGEFFGHPLIRAFAIGVIPSPK